MFKILKNSVNWFGKKYKEGGLFQFVVNMLSPVILGVIIVVFNYLFGVFLNLSVNFRNIYYTLVGLNFDLFESIRDVILCVFFSTACYLVYIYIKEVPNSVREKTLETLGYNSSARYKILRAIKKPQSIKDLTDEENLQELEIIETILNDEMTKYMYTQRYKIKGLYAVLIVLPLYIILSVFISNSIKVKNHIFKFQTTILLPYIGQDEVNKLNSSWALMKNAEDYNKINAQIEEAQKKYLPTLKEKAK